jgi:dienelactone hydrolase
MRFVIQQLLARSQAATGPLAGMIDSHHVGVSGLSLGGATTYGVGFNTCCYEPHVTAVIIMSGVRIEYPTGKYDSAHRPVLIMHGTNDPLIKYSTAVSAYAQAMTPKYFVTLIGAGHAPPYENTPDPHDALVIQVTTDFWNRYLHGEPAAGARIAPDATVPGLASIKYVP